MALAAVAAVPALVLAPPAAADGEPVPLPPLRLRMAVDDTCATASTKTAELLPWTHQALQLPRSWQLSRGAGVTVAVIDTGVAARTPALKGRVTAVGEAGEDCVGHGSFAAGLIAAAATGPKTVTGVAPGAEILALRGTDALGNPDAARIAQGIRTAADEGAGVVYVGQVLTGDGEDLADAVAYALDKDALVVAPAAPDVAPQGADGRPDTRPRAYWPARVPDVVSVVDHGPAGTRPEAAPGALAPDLSAPGDAVVGIGVEGDGHFLGSGSSLAAAHVAGAAALVRSYLPGLSAAEVARRLQEAAYPDSVPRLDAYAGLTAVLPTTRANAEARPEPARMPHTTAGGTRDRALLLGGGALCVVLLIGAAMVVVPLGKARGWRPAQ
ncbi:S8 family serine peptidase [Streptomyces capillispiralis]|uniref:Subtilase family protein n=1 Tax=Streptomyces capillispiralis TaxID=68182 RepID=A0A561SGM8_9ACTN|nr:subtilase family protein [Streptomyces capillispiralis]GHE24034.1 type VII secretion-associated serine protease [Streptomyces capillispiralis]